MGDSDWSAQSSRARAAAHAASAPPTTTAALLGGRSLALARAMSSVRGASGEAGQRALEASSWRLRDAVDVLRRECAGVGDVWPVGRSGERRMNVGNAGNTCYIGAVCAAMFGEWDAFDGGVVGSGGEKSGSGLLASLMCGGNPGGVVRLRGVVREVVNRVRKGEVAGAAAVEAVRGAVRECGFSGGRWSQEDAAEFFACLVDALGVPYLSVQERLLHNGVSEASDERVSSERLLWVDLGLGGGLRGLVEGVFLGERVDGLRRGGDAPVQAWRERRLLPFWTPVASTGEVAAVNDARKFGVLAVPFGLRRFGADGKKMRTRVSVEPVMDFTDCMDGETGSTGRYALVLRSVVCHLGSSLTCGHYVSWTYSAYEGSPVWTRWDDLAGGEVRRVHEADLTSADRNEIEMDGYILFYELVPGDGSTDPRDSHFFVPDVDLRAVSEDDARFAEALQAIEMENHVVDQCPMQ